jgi:hypothetical protein
VLYGIALGLTFDEFGMWLHLGGSYWQTASWDAVGLLASVLAVIAFGVPSLRSNRTGNWRGATAILTLLLLVACLYGPLERLQELVLPKLMDIEQKAPF